MPEIDERIVRVETKLDFIISAMEKLPPSPVCVAKHTEYEKKFTDIESWRNRAVGAFLVLNLILVFFVDKIKAMFS